MGRQHGDAPEYTACAMQIGTRPQSNPDVGQTDRGESWPLGTPAHFRMED